MRVGEVLSIDVPEFRGLKGEATILGPEKRRYPLTGSDPDEVRVEGLLRAGAYQVSHPAKRTSRQRWLTVNPVNGASDLKPLDEESQEELFGTRNVLRLPYAEVEGQFSRNHEVFVPIVVLVLLAFAVEALVGAWQSRRKARADGRPLTPSPSPQSTEERGASAEVRV
jgi:hypothetical protein